MKKCKYLNFDGSCKAKKSLWMTGIGCPQATLAYNNCHYKPKTVKVKAWAWIGIKGGLTAATVNPCGSKIPCTITILEKDLKGKL